MPELTSDDRELLQRLLSKPMYLPDDFKGWLQRWASAYCAPHVTDLGQLRATRRWHVATSVPTEEFHSGDVSGDLATVGPELTGLANGHWLVMFGFFMQGVSGSGQEASVFFNEDFTYPYSDPHHLPITCIVTIEGNGITWDVRDLKRQNNNSMRMRYRSLSTFGSANYSLRWLAAIQVP